MPPKKQRLISAHKDLFCSCYIVLYDIKTFSSHVRSIQLETALKSFLKNYEIMPLSACETRQYNLFLISMIYFHAAQDTKIQIIVSRSKIPDDKTQFYTVQYAFAKYEGFDANIITTQSRCLRDTRKWENGCRQIDIRETFCTSFQMHLISRHVFRHCRR